MISKAIILIFSCLLTLTACTYTPKPISVNERYEEAKRDLKNIFSQQECPKRDIDFPEALARGLKYNLDFRIKLANAALQCGQFKVAIFTMFPALNVSHSVYNRTNEYASFSVLPNGQPTDILSSTPNTIRSSRVALSWNILDFGLGYVRSKQQENRILIAQEETRKQIQQLAQDILVAYWNAYSAQQLMIEAKEFQKILLHAKNKLALALLDPAIPKESILNYQGALLDGNRHIIQLQYKYDKAIIDLKHLLALPPDEQLHLLPPPLALRQMHDLRGLDFCKLDAITLANRPELRGQDYQHRIAKLGVATAILQALPGITLNEGWNYNSNKFLANNIWVDRSFDVAWNLLNLASLPVTLETANAQIQYEKLKLMALTLTVLTETRYAFYHYETLRKEYEVAHKQTENARAIYHLNRDRLLASLASNQQVVTAKLKTLTAKMDEDLLLADLSTALGELYLSIGSDILPYDICHLSLCEVTRIIHDNFIFQNTWNFKEYVDRVYEKQFGQIPLRVAHSCRAKRCYTLQICGHRQLGKLQTIERTMGVKNQLLYAKTKNNGHDWYILTYGNYSSLAIASNNLKNLPKSLKDFSPWIRPTDGLQWMT